MNMQDCVIVPIGHLAVLEDETVAVEEFAAAMADYRARSGRSFPTWSEVFEVLQSLGYRKVDEGPLATINNCPYGIRVDRNGNEGREIRVALLRLGGFLHPSPAARTYGFATEILRETALNAMRQRYGWTSVERSGD